MAELQQRMSSREFAEWAAYARLDPFGQSRADLRVASLMALTAEINRDTKKRHKPFTPAEFMPEFDTDQGAEPESQYPSSDQLWQKIRGWALIAGAKSGPPEGDPDGSSK